MNLPVDYSLPAVAQLYSYLRFKGWSEQSHGVAGGTWVKGSARLGVPHDNSDSDLVAGSLKRIALFEERPLRDVIESVRFLLYDVTHLRADSDYHVVDTIPLIAASKILASSRRMLQAAGTTARAEKAHIGNNWSTLGNAVVRTALMGHTERGSFVIPVLVPLPEPEPLDVHGTLIGAEDERFHRSAAEPFERRVVRTFAQSFQAIQEIVVQPTRDEPSVDQIYELVYRGVSREFCLSLINILTEPSVREFSARIDWAPAVLPPTTMARPVTIEADAAERVRRVAVRLRQQRVDPNQVFSGTIVQLRHEDPNDPFGEIAVSTIRHGRASEVHVRLTVDKYIQAWAWHSEGRAVLVEGVVRHAPGGPLRVDQPSRIHPVDEMFLIPNQENS
jgi:hypothetical protein